MSTQKTWWGLSFIDSLTNFIDSGRLQRGRAYRTDNRVLSFDIKDSTIKATIRGNINPYFGVTKEPRYKVTLALKSIKPDEWHKIIDLLCQHPGWISKLMLNEIPANIEQAFGVPSFLPTSYHDVDANCSCPDYENPCKHIAGVYYRLADMLDYDPMLLFQLRGLRIDKLHAALKKTELGQLFSEHIDTQKNTEIIQQEYKYRPFVCSKNNSQQKRKTTKLNTPATQHVQNQFWHMASYPEIQQAVDKPMISAALIKKQGDYPAFWLRSNSFIHAMEEVYSNVKKKNKKIFG
ncbi:MAG: hypothetical protein HAW66_02575 [Shewanella sp.]|nr:hypothetical protein [Shewanella sp.]